MDVVVSNMLVCMDSIVYKLRFAFMDVVILVLKLLFKR